MEILPRDVFLSDIALDLPLKDLLHLCATNKTYQNICNDDNFWMKRTKKYFLSEFDMKDPTELWKDYYIELAKLKMNENKIRASTIEIENVDITPQGQKIYYTSFPLINIVELNSKIPIKHIISYGEINKEFYQNEYFWYLKIRREFKNAVKPKGISWKNYYLGLAKHFRLI
jgi:hypothetical protein